MNILIRAIGVSGDLSPDWFRVTNAKNVWVHDLRTDELECVAEEIIEFSNKLRVAAKQAERLVLHFGKYNDVAALYLDSKLLKVIFLEELEVEVY